jgi:hypothetical protein
MASGWFTEDGRQQTLDDLGFWAAHGPGIMAAVLVGSGVSGFRDPHSDIDMLYATEPGAVPAVTGWVTSQMTEQLAPCFATHYQHRDDVFVLCFLLPSGLEIDLGIWSADTLWATKPGWRVVAARDETSRLAVEASLRGNPDLSRPHEARISGDDPLWQFALKWKVASARHDSAAASASRDQLAACIGVPPDAPSLFAAARRRAQGIYNERQQRMIVRLLEPV